MSGRRPEPMNNRNHHIPGKPGMDTPPLPDANCAWFLDIDGTLLEFAETPELVWCDPALIEQLRLLAGASAGALALVSGRPIAVVDRLFAPLRLPVAGQHGAERRNAAGRVQYHGAAPERLELIRGLLNAWAGERPGVLVEDKGLTLAVHFRRAPRFRDELERYLLQLVEGCDGFRLQSGKMVFEVKPAGRDKGTAVAEFMAEPPFCGRRPVFIGDDVTDEYAFTEVQRLGGMTVKVGEGSSVARWRLRDVAAVRAWIAAWLERYGEG